MWRQQTALVFLGLLAGSVLIAVVGSSAADLSLIGYDNRGVVQPQDAAQGQACQPCLPGQSCPPTAADQSDQACQPGSATGGPMILNIGPPPRLYSPSADFGARIAAAPGGIAVVGDDSAPAESFNYHGHTPEPSLMYWTPQPVYSPPVPMSVSHFSMPVYTTVSPSVALAPAYAVPMLPPPASYNPAAIYPNTVAGTALQTATEYHQLSSTCQCGPTCQCGATCSCGGSCNCAATSQADRLDHILQAIDHLEAAGMATEADQLRRQCDAQMRQVVNELKTAEAEITRLRQALAEKKNTAAAVNHPRQPVVTAALPAAKCMKEHPSSVQQAAYFAPADFSTGPAMTLDESGLPAPFVPQPVAIEPTKVFVHPGDNWGIKWDNSEQAPQWSGVGIGR